ncbi:hypothetical protein ACFRFU_52115 [Streptomyces sp. NPDC056704]|uniref:hypothetical protein n=1 Tax=Streptomyces sp. NPDC056704 TaxID=3345917 RepID=UPI0036B1AE5B
MRIVAQLSALQAPVRLPYAVLLTSLPSNDVENPTPVLVRISGHRPEDPPSTPEPASTPTAGRYDAVSRSARGERDD